MSAGPYEVKNAPRIWLNGVPGSRRATEYVRADLYYAMESAFKRLLWAQEPDFAHDRVAAMLAGHKLLNDHASRTPETP